MENVKTLIRGIEDAITADHRHDTDKIWSSAAEGYEQMKQNFTLTAQREFDDAKGICMLFSLGLQSSAKRWGRIAMERKRISRRS